MLQIICIFLPPLLLMCFRQYLLKRKIEFHFSMRFIIEYLLTLLLFTFLCFLTLVIVFRHDGDVAASFKNYSKFVMHYLCMSIFFAIVIPIAEYGIKNKTLSVKVAKIESYGQFKNILVLGYATFLVLINFIRCFDNALWGDEAYTVARSRESLAAMVEHTAADVHPPLYYVFTRIAYLLVGDSGFIYHFVSFLPYFILVIVALTVIRKKLGVTTALTVITFSSITVSAVRYNVEIRMYSWACLFVLLSYLCVYFILNVI